jgi:hypothetical protein
VDALGEESGFQHVVQGPIASVLPEKLLRDEVIGPHLRPTESGTLALGPNSILISPPGSFHAG